MRVCLCVNSISSSPFVGYTPNMIKKAYNLGRYGNGEGISVAVIDFIGNKYIEDCLKVFSDAFDLPAPQTQRFGESRNDTFNFSAYIEPTVDSQWVHAISPFAKINIITAKEYSISGAIEAIEMSKETDSDIILLTFQTSMTDALANKSDIFDGDFIYIASSGDFGAETNFPSCIPQCVSVGGTSLDISPSGERLTEETVWQGSGGGICDYFNIPKRQERMSGIYEITNARRGVPDVSFLADPKNGYSVYHSSTQGSFGWYNVGGTSISASCVAGITANILSYEKFKSIPRGIFTDLLYEFAGGTAYTNEFNLYKDIIKGSNGLFSAQQGYDLCTGLGSLINI